MAEPAASDGTPSSFFPSWLSRDSLGVFLILWISMAVRFPFLHVPLDRDEGGFGYIAWIWRSGGLPYRDAFDNKPPLFYAFYRMALSLFGTTPLAIHLFWILVGLLEVFLFYRLARRWMEEKPALLATLCFSFLAAEPSFGVGNAANVESFLLLPVLVAGLFIPGSAFLCGLAMGAAIMVKQTAVLVMLAFGIYGIIHSVSLKQNSRQLARHAVLYGLGVALIPVGFFLYFWIRGAAADFVYAVWTYNLGHTAEVAQGGRIKEGFQGLWDQLKGMAPAEWGMWALAGMGYFRFWIFDFGLGEAGANPKSKFQNPKWFLSLWTLAAFASLCVSFRFLSHYFIELAPVVALAIGFGTAGLWQRGMLPARVGGVLIAIMVLPYAWANRNYFLRDSPEAISKDLYDGNYFAEAVPLAEYIAEQTQEKNTIFIFGSEPELLFIAHRRSPTRHIFFYPLTIPNPAAHAFQREVARDVEAVKPEMIVWVNNPLSFLAATDTDTFILEKTRHWVTDGEYQLEGVVREEADRSIQFFLGPKAIQSLRPEQVKGAPFILYRLRHGNAPVLH